MKIKIEKQGILKFITSYGRYWIVITPDGEYKFDWMSDLFDPPKIEPGHFTAALPLPLDEKEQLSIARQILDADGRIWNYIQDEVDGLLLDYIDYCRVQFADEWETRAGERLTAVADEWLEDLNDMDSPHAPWGFKGNGDGTYSPVILPFVLEWA